MTEKNNSSYQNNSMFFCRKKETVLFKSVSSISHQKGITDLTLASPAKFP